MPQEKQIIITLPEPEEGMPTIRIEMQVGKIVIYSDLNVVVYPVYITGTPRPKHGPRKDPPAAKEMDEAIPPAFTQYIGEQLMQAIKEVEV